MSQSRKDIPATNDRQVDSREIARQNAAIGRIVRFYVREALHDGRDYTSISQNILASMERGLSDYRKDAGIPDPTATQEIPVVQEDQPSKTVDAFLAGEFFSLKHILDGARERLNQTRRAVNGEADSDEASDEASNSEGFDDVLRSW